MTFIASYFIGGAADKNRFWGIGPKTNLMHDTLIMRYFAAIRSTSMETVELNRSIDSAYWGYDEMDQLFSAIVTRRQQHPNASIRLIGHSLGGWQAAKLSQRLAKAGIPTSLLITIDPVGIGYFMNFPGGETELPRPQASMWINLVANHQASYGMDDGIADAGIRWRPMRDTALKTKPNLNIETPYNHASVWHMMLFSGSTGKCAWQFLSAPVQ